MKRFIILILSLVAAFTVSCKKDKNVPKTGEYYLSASKNNSAWISLSYNERATAKDNQNTFAGIPYYNSYYTAPVNNELLVLATVGEEHLYINFVMSSANTYQFDKANTHFNVTVGQDVLVADYVLDESKNNTANISSLNAANKTINGTFTLYFKKVRGDEKLPATLAFTNGKFYLTTTDK